MTFRDILLVILCYLLGAIPFGYILTRAKAGVDIREHGSGNIGATNVLRTQGKALGVLTLVLDFAKAAASRVDLPDLGLAALDGRGGGSRGGGGPLLPVLPGLPGRQGHRLGAGRISLHRPGPHPHRPRGLPAGGAHPPLGVAREHPGGPDLRGRNVGCHLTLGWYTLPASVIGACLAALLVTRHHTNIRNLLRGTESKLWGPGSRRAAEAKHECP